MKEEPKDKSSFGYALWAILGGPVIKADDAARTLGIHRQVLRRYTHGLVQTSQANVAEKNWRNILQTKYPAGWAAHYEKFNAAYRKLPPHQRSRRIQVPQDKTSFGYILWSILGGDDADFEEASIRLGIGYRQLTAYIENHAHPSREFIEQKKWREIFEKHYASGWAECQKNFEVTFVTLPMGKINGRTKTPKDQNGLGHVLWLIIGGKRASIRISSIYLGISPPSTLSRYIHGWEILNPDIIEQNGWPSVFEKHYPNTWLLHRAEFHRLAKLLPKKVAGPDRARKSKRTKNANAVARVLTRSSQARRNGKSGSAEDANAVSQFPKSDSDIWREWCAEVGALLRAIREERGDDVQDITPNMRNVAVRENYEDMEQGGLLNPVSLYELAFSEISLVYNLSAKNPQLTKFRQLRHPVKTT